MELTGRPNGTQFLMLYAREMLSLCKAFRFMIILLVIIVYVILMVVMDMLIVLIYMMRVSNKLILFLFLAPPQDQYDTICHHTDQGIEHVKRVSNFVKDRIHIENIYAKELR